MSTNYSTIIELKQLRKLVTIYLKLYLVQNSSHEVKILMLLKKIIITYCIPTVPTFYIGNIITIISIFTTIYTKQALTIFYFLINSKTYFTESW